MRFHSLQMPLTHVKVSGRVSAVAAARRSMSGTSTEILDLRHFAASVLQPVLERESALWSERLHWDYRNSTRLLMQYLNNRMLPGFAAMTGEQVNGYAFCVYEETKAVIGDVFAVEPRPQDGQPGEAHQLELRLLSHLLELLLHSPQIDRIESQLLIHPSGSYTDLFRDAGFELFRRLFLVLQLEGRWNAPQIALPADLELRSWRDEDLTPAARLIAASYRDHPDSLINDQYRTVNGSLRFLNNIVNYAGCGAFSAPVSYVVVHRVSREFVALVLGSRVSPICGHITQVCVHPEFWHQGLARTLLALAAHGFLRQGVSEVSLTVTEANRKAINLYLSEGYARTHSFDAAVWMRSHQA